MGKSFSPTVKCLIGWKHRRSWNTLSGWYWGHCVDSDIRQTRHGTFSRPRTDRFGPIGDRGAGRGLVTAPVSLSWPPRRPSPPGRPWPPRPRPPGCSHYCCHRRPSSPKHRGKCININRLCFLNYKQIKIIVSENNHQNSPSRAL